MKLTLKQTKALDILQDKETTELLFGGGAGGGKSAFGCYWQLKNRLKYEGSRGLIGRSKLKVLKDTTLKTFKEIASLQGVKEGYHYYITSGNHKEHPNSIVFYNGSLIYLRDLFQYPQDEEFDDLGSLEITDAFLDECNQMVQKAKDIVKSRIRYKLDAYCDKCGSMEKKEVLDTEFINGIDVNTLWICSNNHTTSGLMPKSLLTCNPAKNWTYRQFYKLSESGSLPPYRKFIQSLLTDNPNISRHYRENLLTLDKNSRERLLNGNWAYDDDPASLIDADARFDYFNSKHLSPGENKYMTIDVARKGKDKTIFRIWEGWLCTHRYEMKENKITEAVTKGRRIQKKHNIPLSNIVADEDGVGGGYVDMMGCKGFVNNGKPMNELISGKIVTPNYANLKSQCSVRMANKIQLREAAENCEISRVIDQTSEEMEQVKQRDIHKDGKIAIMPKDKVKENLGRSPDDWDSIMMRYYFELTIESFFF